MESKLPKIDIPEGLLDFHTHRPSGITAFNPDELPEAILSVPAAVGIHPWQSDSVSAAKWLKTLPMRLSRPDVVAVGEVGIDPNRGAPLDFQIDLARQQLTLASEMHLPAIIHSVKSSHLILQLYDQIRPSRPWAIHAFNGNNLIAGEFARRNIYMSLGSRSSDRAVLAVPDNLLLLETDAYPSDSVTIDQILLKIASIRQVSPAAIGNIARSNLRRFFN